MNGSHVMYGYTEKRCVHCHLQEDPFHGVTIDAEGRCSLCAGKSAPSAPDWAILRDLFASSWKGSGAICPTRL